MKSKLGYKYIYKSIIKLQIIIFLYPNLAKNKLTLDIKGNKEKVEIFIYDLKGRVINMRGKTNGNNGKGYIFADFLLIDKEL